MYLHRLRIRVNSPNEDRILHVLFSENRNLYAITKDHSCLILVPKCLLASRRRNSWGGLVYVTSRVGEKPRVFEIVIFEMSATAVDHQNSNCQMS